MDKKIKKSIWEHYRALIMLMIVISIGLASAWYVWSQYQDSAIVDFAKLSIAPVQERSFREFINTRGQVQPIESYSIEAIEGGILQKIYHESGERISKGDTLFILKNSKLALEVMQRQVQVYEQINNAKQTRLLLDRNYYEQQEKLADIEYQLNLAEPLYHRKKKFFQDSIIALEEFQQIESRYLYHKRRKHLLIKNYQKDSMARIRQQNEIQNSISRLRQNLLATNAILKKLTVISPMNGVLQINNLKIGSALESGDNLGIIENDDRLELVCSIDEVYLDKVEEGMTAEVIMLDNVTYKVPITKVNSVVEEGYFTITIGLAKIPKSKISIGQTIRLKLFLTSSKPSLVIPNGAFYNQSGGQFVYALVSEDKAIKKNIVLGRQNPDYLEVSSGLKVGERIIISSYSDFAGKGVLEFKKIE